MNWNAKRELGHIFQKPISLLLPLLPAPFSSCVFFCLLHHLSLSHDVSAFFVCACLFIPVSLLLSPSLLRTQFVCPMRPSFPSLSLPPPLLFSPFLSCPLVSHISRHQCSHTIGSNLTHFGDGLLVRRNRK